MDTKTSPPISFAKRDTEHYDYPRLCVFSDSQDVGGLQAALGRPNHENVLDNCIYIHVPFCTTLCTFCNYSKTLDRSVEEKDQYVAALVREIDFYGRYLHASKRAISGVHFGGGTPSLLSGKHFKDIGDALKRNFDMAGCDTYSLEGTVKSLAHAEKLNELAENNFTRVSFGVQTLNRDIRKSIGVRYEDEQLLYLCDALPKHGIGNFNADLMYNLPRQDSGEVKASIEALFTLGVNNIDLYFLNVYSNTNMEWLMKKRDEWADYNNAEKQLAFARDLYEGIGQSRETRFIFSNTISRKSEKVHRTLANALGNNRYRGGNQISFGVSSRGYIDGYVYRNDPSLSGYMEKVSTFDVGQLIGKDSSEEEVEDRTMVMFPNFISVNRRDVRGIERHEEKIEHLLNTGVLEAHGDHLVIPERYCFFAGNISSFFQSRADKIKATSSYLKTRAVRLNFYNQDKTNITKHVQ